MSGRFEREGTAIRVAVVEPYGMARAALGAVIERAGRMCVVAAAAACPDALAACSEPPDVLVVSVEADADLDALPATADRLERPRVLVLGGELPECLPKRAAVAGASGFVCKRESAGTLLRAIERVHEGEVWFDGATMAVLIAEAAGLRPSEPEGAAGRAAALSARERDIVGYVTEGLKNRELAERCGVSEAAVRHALTRIYRALGVKNRLELARLALETGIGARERGASGG